VALRRHALGHRAHLGLELADDERPVVVHDRELLLRDVRERRPEPARVLEAHRGQDLHLRGDHVRGVEAAPQAGLDHDDLDPAAGELVVRGRGQRLELGHVVVGLGGAVDQLGRLGRAAHRRGEVALRDRLLPHLDPLAERAQVR
jgi:hypothetical protein